MGLVIIVEGYEIVCPAYLNSGERYGPRPEKTFFREYVCAARESDRLWAVALLLGRKPRRVAPVATLKAWAIEAGNVAPWLFEESFLAVGELAETIALILPAARYPSRKSLRSG
jgi:hypothetical protein